MGSKNPLEWILEFYKETKNEISKKSSNNEKVRKRFTTYKFADYKEDVITLLNRVTTVCVETVRLRKELENMEWGDQPKLKFTPISSETKIKSKPGRGKLKTKLKKTINGKTQKTFDGVV